MHRMTSAGHRPELPQKRAQGATESVSAFERPNHIDPGPYLSFAENLLGKAFFIPPRKTICWTNAFRLAYRVVAGCESANTANRDVISASWGEKGVQVHAKIPKCFGRSVGRLSGLFDPSDNEGAGKCTGSEHGGRG